MKNFFSRYDKSCVLLFLFGVSVCYALIAVVGHEKYETFGWDLGYFDQIVWKMSSGMSPFSTLSHRLLFAVHFSPILYIFALFYRVVADIRVLLIGQAFLVIGAGYFLYLLALLKTHSRVFSASVVFSYVFFFGTQWSVLNEFHELAFAPLFLILIFYGLESKRRVVYWAGIVGLLGTKEELAVLLASIGLSIALYFRRTGLGLGLFFFSLLFFFFLTEYFLPVFSPDHSLFYGYITADGERSPLQFLIHAFSSPFSLVRSAFTPIEKLSTFVVSFLSFGLLPLLAPVPFLLPIAEQFGVRFLYSGPQFTLWQNVNHHASPLAMLLPIAGIYGAVVLLSALPEKRRPILFSLSALLFFSTLSQDILLKAPLHSLFKRQFYERSPWMHDADEIATYVNRIPPSVPVAVQNSLFPHVSHRKTIYLLPTVRDAEYLAVDFHTGPNKYAPYGYDEMKTFISHLVSRRLFFVIFQRGDAMVLQKIVQK